jgi:ribosomal protein S18 acetylase RimI-like enzyme
MTNIGEQREGVPEKITIAKAAPADRERVAEMFAMDMRDLGIDRTTTKLLPVVDATIGDDTEEGHIWIARVGTGEIAGVMLAAPFWSLKMAGKGLWIETIYVRPEFRRRGIARDLVEYLLDWAEDKGYKGIELEAYHMNTAASCLYRAQGFRRLARERYCYHFGIDD